MTYKTLAFFGHRKIVVTDTLIIKLRNLIERFIVSENFGYFYFGGFGDFDQLCYNIVSELKAKYPHIQRIYVYEDENFLRKKPKYLLHEEYEYFVYYEPKVKYWYYRILFRNFEIIDRSDYIIFFVNNKENSGACKAMNYAKSKKKSFVNLGNEKNI